MTEGRVLLKGKVLFLWLQFRNLLVNVDDIREAWEEVWENKRSKLPNQKVTIILKLSDKPCYAIKSINLPLM